MNLQLNKQAGSAPILIVIAVIVVLGIGAALWYVFTQNTSNNSDNNDEKQATIIEGTMFDAASQGQPLECDWKLDYDGPAELTEGKFYTDGTNGRSEASYEYEGTTYQAFAIINEDRTYHWSSPSRGGNVEGISDKREAYEAREPKYDLLDTSVDVDFNADYTFTCQPWTIDESVFVAPGDLQFLIL